MTNSSKTRPMNTKRSICRTIAGTIAATIAFSSVPLGTAWAGWPNGRTLNGMTLNGVALNGTRSNQMSLNAVTMNGIRFNQMSLNGVPLNGTSTNGGVLQGVKENGIDSEHSDLEDSYTCSRDKEETCDRPTQQSNSDQSFDANTVRFELISLPNDYDRVTMEQDALDAASNVISKTVGDWETRQSILGTDNRALNLDLDLITRSFEVFPKPSQKYHSVEMAMKYEHTGNSGLQLNHELGIEKNSDDILARYTWSIGTSVNSRCRFDLGYTAFQSIAGSGFRERFVGLSLNIAV